MTAQELLENLNLLDEHERIEAKPARETGKWSADDLASLMRRNAETVRQNYLRPSMREGRIVMTNPDEPNDPQQAYRAAEEQ